MRYFLLLFIALSTFFAKAQVLEPVKWSTEVEKLSEDEYLVTFNATIDPGWHMYSQEIAEDGPIPTAFEFLNTENKIELLGGTSEPEVESIYDEVFEMNIRYFSNSASFSQKIKVLDPEVNLLTAQVTFMVCDDKQCLPPDTVDLPFTLDGGMVDVQKKKVDESSLVQSDQLKLEIKNPGLLVNASQSKKKEKGIWGIFVLGFLGGLIALLTPCVFPMIPLTVSFFTKQAKNRGKGVFNAVLYGVFIVLIYFLLSLPFHLMDNIDSEILNNISTNVWLNILFFAIFVFFAFSFFGYYELTLPASWGNKMDSASNVGGVVGIFFMAVTLAIVSFSCTGPILGGLLGSTTLSEGNVTTNLSAGMTGFGAALALPFALFAMFPAWLNSLPKSGGWLTVVKVHLGFAELALAFKFLSNADLVEHWGLLKREIFIAIWMIILLLWALYTFGKLKFPHDSPIKKLSFSRISFGVLLVAFLIYLIPGLQKNPMWNLSLLSGFPPPQFYSIYEQENDCPLGIDCYKDFEHGLAAAKAQNKPIMLDFTGWACVNCRKMEENVWIDSKIYSMLKNDYILISLYVDDRKELPEENQFDYELDNGRVKSIKTIGAKWATFQTINFKTASQPYYILMDSDFNLLNGPQQYTDADTYEAWLREGLANFELKGAKPAWAF